MQETRRIDNEIVEVTCPWCSGTYLVKLTESQEREWRAGEFIQDVAPDLPEDDRELLISGTCPECWSDMEEE